MNSTKIIPEDFKDFFENSVPSKQQRIISSLPELSTQTSSLDDKGEKQAISCPHCGDDHIRSNGKLKGVQRHVCKGFAKNFRETTDKFWCYIKKKDKMSRYLYYLLSGYNIRKISQETGVSIQTSFDWSHKLLASFATVSPEEFHGITECDDMYFAYSETGSRNLARPARKRGTKASKAGISKEKVAVVATCDRSGNKDFKVATRGHISKKDLEKVLGDKLEKTTVFCSDANRNYTAFAKIKDVQHKKFNVSKGQRAFDGVASKYLQNYLNWFLVLEKIKKSTDRMTTVAAIAFALNTAWMDFKNKANNNVLIET